MGGASLYELPGDTPQREPQPEGTPLSHRALMERQTSNVMPVEPSETAPSAMEEEAYDSATSDAELVVEEYFSEEGDEEDDDDDYVPEAGAINVP